ncbi:MAG: ArsR family transcriptional regulator [Actinomycetota bacterium]|nr:ArsR family transcriptional regulator [Actinomycetota bacterium]
MDAVHIIEHALMSERTREGLESARARGRTGGQKPKLTPRQAKIAQDMYHQRGPDGRRTYTVQQIANEFGVTRPTIYRHLQRQAR